MGFQTKATLETEPSPSLDDISRIPTNARAYYILTCEDQILTLKNFEAKGLEYRTLDVYHWVGQYD